jgi:2-methylisocitrate lyase-like PEP mutase family enzyme
MDLAEREITLDTELVKELCSGVVEPVTIDVQNGYSAAVLTAERAAKDIPCGMYAVIMPIRPESRA